MSHHPEPHPNFRAKFSHPVYTDPHSELGIFGSDEAADVFSEWSSRRKELGGNSTVQQVLGVVEGMSEPDIETDPWIIGAGYTLLWLTGQIDKDGKALLIGALTRESDRFPVASARYAQMMDDLGVKANPKFAEMNPSLREMVDPSYGTIERHQQEGIQRLVADVEHPASGRSVVSLRMSTRDVPEQIGDLPRIGRPANSALLAEGITSLSEVAAFGRKRLADLHGVGPKAIRILADELESQGIEFAD